MYYKWQPYLPNSNAETFYMNACLFNKSTHDSVVYFVVVQFLLKCDTSQVVRCRETPEIRCRKAQVAEAPGKVSFFTGNSILDVEEKLLFRGRQLKWMMFCVS